ncbi:MAG TPA: hypothetical protein VER11_25930 [Polyangiaceae bacterium]|nr:hypothetical protein [Polyangiaceae bacterium]
MLIFRSLFLGLIASQFLLAAGGCSGGGDSRQSAELALLQQFEAEAVQRFCARINACCNELSYPFDEAGCETLNGNRIVQFFNSQAFPGSHYDSVAGKRCLDGIETPELGCSAEGDYESPDCKKVFVGSVSLGGKCSLAQGCATTPDGAATECDFPPSNLEYDDPRRTGVCVLAPPPQTGPHGKAGDACSSSCTESGICTTLCSADRPCATDLPTCYAADGLFCSEANTCVVLGVAGDPCFGSFECGPGTYCDTDQGHCQTLRQAGDACHDGFQCESEYCVDTCMPPPRAYPEFCLGHVAVPPPPSTGGRAGL